MEKGNHTLNEQQNLFNNDLSFIYYNKINSSYSAKKLTVSRKKGWGVAFSIIKKRI